jgi:hypothetical protein
MPGVEANPAVPVKAGHNRRLGELPSQDADHAPPVRAAALRAAIP